MPEGDYLNDKLIESVFSSDDFSDIDKSYSPLFSNFGLILDNKSSGIIEFCLNYNRKARIIWNEFISFDAKLKLTHCSSSGLVFGDNEAFLSFYDTDSFLLDVKGNDDIVLFGEKGNGLDSFWLSEKSADKFTFLGYSLNGDDRDPDENVPFIAGVKVLKGKADYLDSSLRVSPDDGTAMLSFSFSVFDIFKDSIDEKLDSCISLEDAKEKSREWASYCLKDLNSGFTDDEVNTVSKAIGTMLFNLTKAPGNLSGYISSFPSRGGYPTHFLWDSCFQNLAYEIINPRIAGDSLLLHKKNQRSDGKYGQFLCSTWIRPHYSQPALIGWASLRYVSKTGDYGFAEEILPSLEANNYWWLTRRMTDKGIISCPHGLETGQDDSPRFDNGGTYACDMNAYLINQMRCTASLAGLLGDNEKEFRWKTEADKLADNVVRHLYNEEKNIFFDVDISTGKPVEVITTASFMPLWAGVPIAEERIRMMIEDYLLNPTYMFGNIPFPSVAYCDEHYDSSQWWRGPTWMPVAYLMLEILEKYGYSAERITAMKKMYDVILKDGEIHELFDSLTGEGLGSSQQGWTGGIFLDLALKLKEQR